jgi:S1-C subfamily serine protease
MHRWIGALALLTIVMAPAAKAEDWRFVARDDSQTIFLDLSSVRLEGDYVMSTIRTDYVAPQHDGISGKPYSQLIATRADDCANSRAAFTAITMISATGATVSKATIPPARWSFSTAEVHTFGEAIGRIVCPMAGVVSPEGRQADADKLGAGLSQATSLRDTASGGRGWVRVNGTGDDATRTYYRPDSVKRTNDGSITVSTMRENDQDQVMEDVGRYRVAIEVMAINCDGNRISSLESTFLDASGRVVASFKQPASPTSIPEATPAADLKRLLCTAQATAAPAEDEPELSSGTGWLTLKGYIVTASHVVNGADRIGLYQNGNLVGEAEVASDDPANDVALLRPHLKGPVHVAIPLSPRPASLGAPVFTIGYPAPDVMGMSVKVASGEINALSGLDVANERTDDIRLLQISIPTQSGNSGGPVIGGDGQAVGIVISKLERTSSDEIAQNVNYALKVAYLRGLLAELPDIGGYRLVKPALTRTEMVAALQGSIFMIVTVRRPRDHEDRR